MFASRNQNASQQHHWWKSLEPCWSSLSNVHETWTEVTTQLTHVLENSLCEKQKLVLTSQSDVKWCGWPRRESWHQAVRIENVRRSNVLMVYWRLDTLIGVDGDAVISIDGSISQKKESEAFLHSMIRKSRTYSTNLNGLCMMSPCHKTKVAPAKVPCKRRPNSVSYHQRRTSPNNTGFDMSAMMEALEDRRCLSASTTGWSLEDDSDDLSTTTNCWTARTTNTTVMFMSLLSYQSDPTVDHSLYSPCPYYYKYRSHMPSSLPMCLILSPQHTTFFVRTFFQTTQ